jgi:hypothetical protein
MGQPEGQIKDYSHNNLRKNTGLKAALTGSTVRQKAKEERCLLYAPILKLQKRMVSGLMKSVMNKNQNCQSATALWYLRFKPGERGLNSPLTCPAGGGGERGGCGSNTLPNHVTGNGRSTRHLRRVITLRPSALLEISFLFIVSSTPIKSIHYFCDWGRRYSQVRFPAIQELYNRQ